MTQEQIKQGIEITKAMAESIRELGEVPAGHLYAHVMGHMSLEGFKACIGLLVKAGLVREDQSHMLRWTGPAKGGAE